RRDRRRVHFLVDRMQEDVAYRAVERIDRFDEDNQIGARELAEQARRNQHDFVARLELPFVFETAELGPWGQVQREHDDRDQERRRKQQDRAQTRRQRLSGGKPDYHLAVAVPTRKGEQNRQKQGHRQEDVEIKQHRET